MTKSPTNNNKKKAGKAGRTKNEDMNDWITSLVKQSTAASSSAGISTAAAQTSNTSNNLSLLSKEERKQKRAQKIQVRQQRKLEQQQRKLEKQQQRKRSPSLTTSDTKTTRPAVSLKRPPGSNANDIASISKRRLKRLITICEILQKKHSDHRHSTSQPTLLLLLQQMQESSQQLYKKKRSSKPLNDKNIQPRLCDYSGIGLARDSLYIPFQDPSHYPKLEQEFLEHIPGFYGKQRTKAMKRQLDGNMLWRKLVNDKKNAASASTTTANSKNGSALLPKKFRQMSPDERIQAMIDSGMI